MKVSLIITTYNRVHLLRKTYLSILNQSVWPDELVISDDGSSEDIVGGIQDLVDQSKFTVKFVQQADEGFRLAKCRNNGVRASAGDFIIFFDQDLLFTKDYLKTMASAAKSKRFVVGNPIRLSEDQSNNITEKMIVMGDFDPVLSEPEKAMTMKQYRKEYFYTILHAIKLRRLGPKLRGGIVGFNREDFLKVNGYDEKFKGWGNEDDDLGVRFYAAGIRGRNPFKDQYALHLYHHRFHNNERVNRKYQKQRLKEINRHHYKSRNGYAQQDEAAGVTSIVLN